MTGIRTRSMRKPQCAQIRRRASVLDRRTSPENSCPPKSGCNLVWKQSLCSDPSKKSSRDGTQPQLGPKPLCGILVGRGEIGHRDQGDLGKQAV